jgi:crossover junction endodeoxyribonuclease RuvC
MTSRILGIDPGAISGAWAIIGADSILVGDLPVVDRNVSAATFFDLLKELKPDRAIVERVSAMPGNGIASSWQFAVSVGIIHACLSCAEIPLHLVTPSTWKKHFNLSKDKEQSRALAMRLYPSAAAFLSRKKDAGRAEALLIARYHLETKK